MERFLCVREGSVVYGQSLHPTAEKVSPRGSLEGFTGWFRGVPRVLGRVRSVVHVCVCSHELGCEHVCVGVEDVRVWGGDDFRGTGLVELVDTPS